MFCMIFRWLVSRSHDLGKPRSGFVSRHINRCHQCARYANKLPTLGIELKQSSSEFIQENNRYLENKIKNTLSIKPAPQTMPKRRFIPAYPLAAVLAIILVAAFIIFQILPLRTSDPEDPFNLDRIASIDAPGMLKNFTSTIEISVESEIHLLGEHVKSAAQSFSSGLSPEIIE